MHITACVSYNIPGMLADRVDLDTDTWCTCIIACVSYIVSGMLTDGANLVHASAMVSIPQPQLISLGSEPPHRLHHIITAGPAIQPICMTEPVLAKHDNSMSCSSARAESSAVFSDL